jgi:hypothetical protein
MYYILRYDTVSDKEAGELPRPTLPDPRMEFEDGLAVTNPPARITFRMPGTEKGDLGDYVLSGLPGLLISAKFRRALDSAGVDNIQYIPAEIHDEVEKKTYSDYFVANVIGLVDCMDMANSKLTMRAATPDQIRDIDELHIDEARARDHAIFRLDRYSPLVLVNERVKKALTKAKLSGVELVEAEGFSI